MGDSRKSLFDEIDPRDFYFTPKQEIIIINDFEDFLNQNKNLSFDEKKDHFIGNILPERCSRMRDMFEEMRSFIHVEPRLPDGNKEYTAIPRLKISVEQSRDEIMKHIAEMASQNEFAELAWYAYREMDGISWIPFAKAAIERNPVCIEGLAGKTIDEAYQTLMNLPDESIYCDNRLAQPDEVWNFGRGDGMEKAFVLMNYLHFMDSGHSILLETKGSEVVVTQNESAIFRFPTGKKNEKKIWIKGGMIEE